MRVEALTPEQYLEAIPLERRIAFGNLRDEIIKNIPRGFAEVMGYGMIGYVVPHALYPKGYHVNPAMPLPFIGIASQKNFVALYHMGLYSDASLLKWFTEKYQSQVGSKPDMGKSCVRFKKVEKIPLKLIGELVRKITPAKWIALYEKGWRQ
jgi:hypothetical protein